MAGIEEAFKIGDRNYSGLQRPLFRPVISYGLTRTHSLLPLPLLTVTVPTVDASKSPAHILFEGVTGKAGGEKRVEEVILRPKNNSDCAIILEAAPNRASQFSIVGGGLVRHEIGEIKDRQVVGLKLLMRYPKQRRLVMSGLGGDVLDYVKLGVGNSVLSTVPLEIFRRRGKLHLPYRYYLESRPSAATMAGRHDSGETNYSEEHYVTFGPQHLPSGVCCKK